MAPSAFLSIKEITTRGDRNTLLMILSAIEKIDSSQPLFVALEGDVKEFRLLFEILTRLRQFEQLQMLDEQIATKQKQLYELEEQVEQLKKELATRKRQRTIEAKKEAPPSATSTRQNSANISNTPTVGYV